MDKEELAFSQGLCLIWKQTCYVRMLILISTLICNEYFHMTRIIHARIVQTVCNIKLKPWSYISGPGFWVLDCGFQILGLGSLIPWFLDLRFWVQGVRSRVLGLGPFSNYYKVWQKALTKCDKKLLQSVTKSYYKVWQEGISKCDKKLLQSVTRSYWNVWQEVITKCGRYYKVW